MTATAPNLLILRHAHSSWALPGQRDHQRPLDKRGREEAERLAALLKADEIALDAVHCSTASRARETFDIVAPAFASIGRTQFSDDLYALGVEAYFAVAEAEAESRRVLVVGHNPMIEDFVLSLVTGDPASAGRLRMGFPTCGFASVTSSEGIDGFKTGRGVLERLVLPEETA